jgi:3-oxoacyl-[acyl-carrier protein] reductase
MPEQSNRVAVVTGGARGIGRGCALEVAARGFTVVLVDLLVPEMEKTAAEIRAGGGTAACFEADVASFARAHEVAGEIQRRFGRIDFLLNNAGQSMAKGLLELTEAEWDRTLAVNLKSCFNWCKAVAPIMLAQGGGRIVNMSSLNAYTGGVTSAVSKVAYAAAKAGILGLTRALAKELAPAILVNAICPGFIETELVAGLIEGRRAELTKGIALGRLGTPEDVAQLVAFLATAEPCFITGQDFTVDGFQWVI